MSGRFRTTIRVGAFAALAVLLTGCIKLNMNLGINDDNTVSGTIQFGVQKELLELSGQNADDLLGSDSPFPTNAPGVKVEPFDDGTFAGQQFTFESVPLEEFNSGGFAGATGLTGVSGSSDVLNIQRQGDTRVIVEVPGAKPPMATPVRCGRGKRLTPFFWLASPSAPPDCPRGMSMPSAKDTADGRRSGCGGRACTIT